MKSRDIFTTSSTHLKQNYTPETQLHITTVREMSPVHLLLPWCHQKILTFECVCVWAKCIKRKNRFPSGWILQTNFCLVHPALSIKVWQYCKRFLSFLVVRVGLQNCHDATHLKQNYTREPQPEPQTEPRALLDFLVVVIMVEACARTCAGERERAGGCDPAVSSVSVSDCSAPSAAAAGDHSTSATSGTCQLRGGVKHEVWWVWLVKWRVWRTSGEEQDTHQGNVCVWHQHSPSLPAEAPPPSAAAKREKLWLIFTSWI